MKSEWGSENKELTHLYIYEQLKRMDRINEKKWKFVAIFSALCLSFTLMLLAYTINLPKTVPLVISVSDFGEAKYVGAANKLSYSGMKIPQVAIEYQIRKFVINKFSLSTDGEVCRNNIREIYTMLTSTGSVKYSDELRDVNPLADVGKIIRSVDIESVLKLSSNSYQIDFYVNTENYEHRQKTASHIRGIVQTELLAPDKEDLIKNPLGIYIKDYDFTEIKTGVDK